MVFAAGLRICSEILTTVRRLTFDKRLFLHRSRVQRRTTYGVASRDVLCE